MPSTHELLLIGFRAIQLAGNGDITPLIAAEAVEWANGAIETAQLSKGQGTTREVAALWLLYRLKIAGFQEFHEIT